MAAAGSADRIEVRRNSEQANPLIERLLRRGVIPRDTLDLQKGQYFLICQNSSSQEGSVQISQLPRCGLYNFVKRLDGRIFVAQHRGHLWLAENEETVLGAGEIMFGEQGQIISWNVKSGTYRHDENDDSYIEQIGLPKTLKKSQADSDTPSSSDSPRGKSPAFLEPSSGRFFKSDAGQADTSGAEAADASGAEGKSAPSFIA